MREILCAMLLVAAALAGCIGSDDGSAGTASDPGATRADGPGRGNATSPSNGTDSSPPNETEETQDGNPLGTLSDGTPVPTQYTVTGCSEQIGAFPVPASSFDGDLPDGFSTVPFDPAGQTATVVVLGLSCSLEDGSDYAEMTGFVQVEPPEDLARDGADFHYLLLGQVNADERQAEILGAWGLGDAVQAGNVQFDATDLGPAARNGQVAAETQDFSFRMDSGVGGSSSGTEAGAARLFGVENGTVSGVVDVDWTTSANGYQTGAGQLSIGQVGPVPQPQGEGIALHFWGPEYTITFQHVDLPAREGS